MPNIHPTAIVDPKAELADDVEIGPYSVIGPEVIIGAGTVIGPSVFIEKRTTLGCRCKVSKGAVLGTDPQDLRFKDKKTYLVIGDDCVLREFVTVNVATSEEKPTRLGNNIMMMAYSHIAHDCQIGNGVIMANCASLAGHIHMDDGVILGGLAAIHQFSIAGKYCIIGGFSRVTLDILPFSMAAGCPCKIHGLNMVGLKRRGFSKERLSALHQAFKILLRKGLSLPDATKRLQDEMGDNSDVQEIIAFIQRSKRGIARH
ncbi:MAG TPA: acyl-ACP--UDP-N-acetylglucosamine O-acyltransferase [bacterium]|nr:acyl-ACP--UDP-N-acetylglucosamine O-acyltransferase [bacterium]